MALPDPDPDGRDSPETTTTVVRDEPESPSGPTEPLDTGWSAPTLSDLGGALGKFRLLTELGSGALGRVILATQTDLADRPVVLKLTPCDGGEHLSLARLQHTHIVPLYGVRDEPTLNLRLLCMPYFGSATLAKI